MTYPCCNGTASHAGWCNSILRRLAAEQVTYTPVVRHETAIQADRPESIDNKGQFYVTRDTRHRWSCSCGKQGRWVTRRLQAEQGAATHRRRVK